MEYINNSKNSTCSPTTSDEKGSPNIFSNDGSFMSQYKALLEKQNKEKQEKEAKEKKENEESQRNSNEIQEESDANPVQEENESFESQNHNTNERRPERGSR